MHSHSIVSFTSDLLEGRHIRVGRPVFPSPAEARQAVELVSSFEQAFRVDFPGEPPAFDGAAAHWAAVAFYLSSALVIHRDSGIDALNPLQALPIPDRNSPAAHYTVDLVMRFLPDLTRLAKSASLDDPVVARLLDWAQMWPLSSVGIAHTIKVDATPLRTSAPLMRLYVDRILAAQDASRLDDANVRIAVATALGEYPRLCPKIASLAISQANVEAPPATAGPNPK